MIYPTISYRDFEVFRRQGISQMFSAFGQKIRLEWKTEATPGTANARLGINIGSTYTDNVLDTRAIITRMKRKALELLDKSIIDASPVLIQIETDINLKNRPNFTVVQQIENEYWNGDGTASAKVWTADDSAPGWTTNQWKGFDILFSSSRFNIVSNTTTALTLDATGAPDSEGTIMSTREWYSVLDAPDLGSNMNEANSDGVLFQTVLCTKIPIRGDSID